MSVRVLPREIGVTLACDIDECPETLTTAQIQAGLIRGYAKTRGWIRGGAGDKTSPSRKRWDICPTCAPAERERLAAIAKAKEERKAARDKARIERANLKAALPKKPRKPRKPTVGAAQEASASP